jgi:hypothetical protein
MSGFVGPSCGFLRGVVVDERRAVDIVKGAVDGE